MGGTYSRLELLLLHLSSKAHRIASEQTGVPAIGKILIAPVAQPPCDREFSSGSLEICLSSDELGTLYVFGKFYLRLPVLCGEI